jgi:hypothetical protein
MEFPFEFTSEKNKKSGPGRFFVEVILAFSKKITYF